jgi:hypothetical protein
MKGSYLSGQAAVRHFAVGFGLSAIVAVGSE